MAFFTVLMVMAALSSQMIAAPAAQASTPISAPPPVQQAHTTGQLLVELAPSALPSLSQPRLATEENMLSPSAISTGQDLPPMLTWAGFRSVRTLQGGRDLNAAHTLQARLTQPLHPQFLQSTPPSVDLHVVDIPARMTTSQALKMVQAHPQVAFAAPNRRYTVKASGQHPVRLASALTETSHQETARAQSGQFVVPASSSSWAGAGTNDTYARYQWGLSNPSDHDIDFREAWARQRGQRKVKVALLDTGVDINHPDLRSSLWVNHAELHGKAGVDDDGNGCVDDVHGCNVLRGNGNVYGGAAEDLHGTHVAGTLAATAGNKQGIAGVAPGVSLVPVKMIGSQGGTTADAIAALRYAKRIGASIANASWGGYVSDPALQREISVSPLLVVAAAGNDGVNLDELPYYPASFRLKNLISVGALGRNGRLADWSNFSSRRVDVAAPGVEIISTGPEGKYFSEDGTSMATPHVSGIAALQASQYVSWSPQKAVVSLKNSVKPRSALKSKVASSGITNAALALGARQVSGLKAAWVGPRLQVSWANPTDTSFRSTQVRLAQGRGIPSPSGGAPIYSGRGNTVTLPTLRPGFDHTVAVFATDARGARSPMVLRVDATTIRRTDSARTLGMRVTVKSSGAPLQGRTVRLVRFLATGPRVLCTRTTNTSGRASCPASRGRLEWQFASSGTYHLRSTSQLYRR